MKALITGASSGIGRATAFQLAKATNGNLSLVLSARRQHKLDQVRAELHDQFPAIRTFGLALDVSKPADSISKTLDTIPADFGDINVLVNNAGLVLGNEPVGSVAQSDVDIMFNTNVLGLFALTQYYVRRFKAQRTGDIVNVGSVAGIEPYVGGSVYCATKAAVRSMTHSLRKETVDQDIRVMLIEPGQVETEFSVVRMRGDQAKADAVYEGVEPLTPQDVAELIVFGLTRRRNVVLADSLLFHTHQASATNIYRS